MANYIEAIKNRTSIRTFDKEPNAEVAYSYAPKGYLLPLTYKSDML